MGSTVRTVILCALRARRRCHARHRPARALGARPPPRREAPHPAGGARGGRRSRAERRADLDRAGHGAALDRQGARLLYEPGPRPRRARRPPRRRDRPRTPSPTWCSPTCTGTTRAASSAATAGSPSRGPSTSSARRAWRTPSTPTRRTRAASARPTSRSCSARGACAAGTKARELAPGLTGRLSRGHTAGLVIPVVEARDDGPPLAVPTDLVPTRSHLKPAWVMAYDNLPATSVAEKRERSSPISEHGRRRRGQSSTTTARVEAAWARGGELVPGALSGPAWKRRRRRGVARVTLPPRARGRGEGRADGPSPCRGRSRSSFRRRSTR